MLDRISPSMPAGLTVAATMLLAVLIPVPAATAGEYHVYSCRTPTGEPAPTDGWSHATSGAAGYAECGGAGTALVAELPAEMPHASTDLATWTFSVPSKLVITEATVWRAGDALGGTGYVFWFAGPSNVPASEVIGSKDVFDGCMYSMGCNEQKGDRSVPLSEENRLPVPAANLGGTHLYANASCSGSCASSLGDGHGYAAVVYIYAADLVLQESTSPSASNIMGALAEQSTLSGTADMRFTAKDEPSGIYQAIVKVDEGVVESPVLDSNGGHCVAHGADERGALAFFYVQPCESTVSATLQLDTTKLTDGVHHVVVEVSDAAGNRTPVIDRQVTVANHTSEGTSGSGAGGGTSATGSGSAGTSSGGVSSALTSPLPGALIGQPNGSGASDQATLEVHWAGTHKSRITVACGHARSIGGLLKGPRGPISGAQIEVQALPAYAGARAVSAGVVRTDSGGRFAMRLRGAVSSRMLRFSYRAHIGDSHPAATGSLTLAVHAGIKLRIAPRIASAGRRIFFRGTLRGGPIPAGGKQLVLEARSAHSRWLQFHVVRTDGRGRFHASYRFRFAGPVRYSFRVVSNYEADFPFLGGASNVVRVFER